MSKRAPWLPNLNMSGSGSSSDRKKADHEERGGLESILTTSERQLLDGTLGDEGNEEEAVEDDPLEMSIVRNILSRSPSGLSEVSEKSFETPKRSSSRGKAVSFTGIDSPGSSLASSTNPKGADELQAKVDKYKNKYKEAEIALSAEKTIRKKKERNLVKLARELNKRATEQGNKDKEIEKLKGDILSLQAKLEEARGESDKRTLALETKARNHTDEIEAAQKKFREKCNEHDDIVSRMSKAHASEVASLGDRAQSLKEINKRLQEQLTEIKRELTSQTAASSKAVTDLKIQLAEAEQKYRDSSDQHDSYISDLTKKHTDQSEDLRREILTAKLETDKLRSQLASLEMASNPEAAGEIADRALRASFKSAEKKTNQRKEFSKALPIILVVGVAFFVFQMKLFSLDSACSPIAPGVVPADGKTYVAPWWAPSSMKDSAYESLCQSRPNTTLNWIAAPGTQGGGQLTVSDTEGRAVLVRKTHSARVFADHFKFVDKKGKIETLKTPWSI